MAFLMIHVPVFGNISLFDPTQKILKINANFYTSYPLPVILSAHYIENTKIQRQSPQIDDLPQPNQWRQSLLEHW